MKKCTKCGVEKTLPEFGKDKHTKDKLNRRCKKCATQISIECYKRNPNTKRSYNLMREYGITLEKFESMKIDQDNKCAICFKPFKNSVDTCVDHCHDSNTVRGLLCNHCNRAIGLFKESVESIQSALLYLEKYK